MIRVLAIISTVLSLSGCVGLAVGTYGTFENKEESFSISSEKNSFEYSTSAETLTKEQLVSTWGEPDQISMVGSCEVVAYNDGFSWSGVGAFLVIIPIPLLAPSGYDENRFYFINGQAVGLVTEYGEVTGGLGYMCGSNECSGLAGEVNKDKTRQIQVPWCG